MSQKPNFFKRKWEAKLRFPEEWGIQTKKLMSGRYGYFLEQHIYGQGYKRP